MTTRKASNRLTASENPWIRLPKEAPFALPEDAPVIAAHNAKCHERQELAFNVNDVLPEPFIGNALSTPVVILLLNPGFNAVADPIWHADSQFREALMTNMSHSANKWPFYYLNPAFGDHPGSIWWHRKLNLLKEQAGASAIAQSLAVIQWFPYKSTRFKPCETVPSQDYSCHLVLRAIARKALIVLARSQRLWQTAVPELIDYERCVTLSSVQNVVLTPNNLLLHGCKTPEAWEMLTAAISR